MTGDNGAQHDLRWPEPFPDARVLLARYGLPANRLARGERDGLDLDAVPSAPLPRRG